MIKTGNSSYGWQYLLFFAIAMGFLESAVVVYIRELYYPEGFGFPLIMIDSHIMLTEFLREAATLIMLVTLALLIARRGTERFAYFILAFAVWDIFYYVFLKLLIGWPESFLTWDVLFFIPTTWVGPVAAPLINSCCMIILAITIIRSYALKKEALTGRWAWLLLVTGSVVVIVSYTLDYSGFMLEKFGLSELTGLSGNESVLAYASTYIPDQFNWWLFATGVAMHLAAIALIWKKNFNA